jgi:hypothetical protein
MGVAVIIPNKRSGQQTQTVLVLMYLVILLKCKSNEGILYILFSVVKLVSGSYWFLPKYLEAK